jgi:hypothetical protein
MRRRKTTAYPHPRTPIPLSTNAGRNVVARADDGSAPLPVWSSSCPYAPECVEGVFWEFHIQHRAYHQSYRSVNCPIAAVLLIGLDTASCGATYTFIAMNELGVSIPFDRPPHPPAGS